MAKYETANETLAATYDDHDWTKAVFDTNTTAGIQLTLKAQTAAIQALADHIDGVDPANPKPAPTDKADRQGNTTPTGKRVTATDSRQADQRPNPNHNPNPV